VGIVTQDLSYKTVHSHHISQAFLLRRFTKRCVHSGL
jgi:hypothetical protein